MRLLKRRRGPVEIPCSKYSAITHLGYRTKEQKEQLRRLWKRDKPFLQLAEHVMRTQLHRQSHTLIENPLHSRIWKFPDMMHVRSLPGVHVVDLDMYVPVRREARRHRQSDQAPDQVGRRCHGLHQHDPYMGSTRAVAHIIHEAVRQGRGSRRGTGAQWPTMGKKTSGRGAQGHSGQSFKAAGVYTKQFARAGHVREASSLASP